MALNAIGFDESVANYSECNTSINPWCGEEFGLSFDEKSKKIGNLFIINLALADLIVSFCCI